MDYSRREALARFPDGEWVTGRRRRFRLPVRGRLDGPVDRRGSVDRGVPAAVDQRAPGDGSGPVTPR